MKPGLFASVLLAVLWLLILFGFLQHAAPVNSSPVVLTAASLRDVVINEVAWSGTAASSNDEWIELYNNTAQPISLTGWLLEASVNGPDITLNGVLSPHGYFVLERTDDNTISGTVADQIYGNDGSTWALNDSGEVLTLTDNLGNVIDTANGDGGAWPAGTDGSGTPLRASMERINPAAPDTGDNWASNDGVIRNGLDANSNPINGTPKQPNSATAANLGIIKSAPSAVLTNQKITFTLTFSNAGRLDAGSAIITDVLPISTTFVTQTAPFTFTQNGQTLVWEMGTLAASNGTISFTVVVMPETGLTGWVTNTAIITSQVADYRPDNNISTIATQITAQAADLSIHKSGPVSAMAGTEITYVVTLSNVGQLTASGVCVTDTLPLSVTLVRQSALYTLTQQNNTLVWDVGDVPTSGAPISWTATGLVDLHLTGTITNVVQAGATTDEAVTTNNSDRAATLIVPPTPIVLINGVLYDGYQLNDEDEAIQIVNVGPLPVNLQGWRVTEGSSSGVAFPVYSLGVNQSVWAAKDAQKFHDSFGFWPDFAKVPTGTAALLTGSWPGLPNDRGGDVQVKDAVGNALDHLVYATNTLAVSGWLGPGVYPYSIGAVTGQIIARIPDEHTGLPAPDTNTAADWLQSTDNYITGRRVMYPGWDMDLFFQPFVSTEPATVTLGIAPDNAFDVVRSAIRSAQRSIEIEAYELRNYGVITEVVQKARVDHVTVTLLLEGEPVGGMSDQELWACQEIEAAGGQCWFMHNDSDSRIYDRYDLIHAKLVILDRQRLVVSTQNLSSSGLPDDVKTDGTYGSRGYVLYIESPELAQRARLIFDRDRDPAHADITRWSPANPFGFGSPPGDYVPITTSGGTTSTVLFPTPQVLTDATRFELFTAPEASLRQSDGLLGLLAQAQAGDEVYVEQMYEYPDWGDQADAPNLRLKAYVDAARRGAKVQILLNSGTFDQDSADLTKNITATAYVNLIAQQEGLDLQARMGDPTRYGIHSKIVLVKLNSQGGLAYSHVGSINGSEASNKINRELAVQVESGSLFAEMALVFRADWQFAAPICLPLVMREYRPPANYVLISEVLYDPSGADDKGKEWIELYNPTSSPINISGWSLGDAAVDGEYGSGRYLFLDNTILQPGGVIVIAGQANDVSFTPNLEFLIDPNRNNPSVPDMIPAGAWSGFGLALSNTGDEVILLNGAGQPVDVVTWGTGSYPGVASHPGVSASDHSLERRPPNYDTNDCSRDFFDRTPPTPGYLP